MDFYEHLPLISKLKNDLHVGEKIVTDSLVPQEAIIFSAGVEGSHSGVTALIAYHQGLSPETGPLVPTREGSQKRQQG